MSNNLGNKETMAKNIMYFMEQNNKSRNEMCQILNVPYTTFADWIKAKTYPRIDKIEAMANYFGISKADLVEEKPAVEDNDRLLRTILSDSRKIKLAKWIAGLDAHSLDRFEKLLDAVELLPKE